ncbi:MAG: hypothetical protein ACRDRV_15575, partial [Pseudonocardiaceae bacterium]
RDPLAQDDAEPGDADAASPQPGEPSPQPAAEQPLADKPPGAETAGAGDVEASEVEAGDSEAGDSQAGETGPGTTEADEVEPDEEDTDAADLLVVWELSDEVLVVDEHPRYHLARCSWPDAAATESLPVQEARELGFTPCAQCRPDTALARKRRAALAKQDPAKQDTGSTDTRREPDREADQGASSGGGQDSDSSAVLG